jgi:prepilin peptidase CpaA
VLELLLLTVFPAAVAYAAFSDVLRMKIPNMISVFLIAAFFLLAPFVFNITTIGWHVVAFVAVLAVTFSLFAGGFIGGGDAKLLAVIALWLGLDFLLPYLFWATVFGGGIALAFMGFRKIKLPEHLAAQPWVARLHTQGHGIPYGLALGAAALFIYPKTPWVASLLG